MDAFAECETGVVEASLVVVVVVEVVLLLGGTILLTAISQFKIFKWLMLHCYHLSLLTLWL